MSAETDAPPQHTEATMTRLLDRRYGAVSMGARRYATVAQVRDQPGFAHRICDYLALDTYRVTDGDWQAPRYAVHGHEIKVSRADWLTELRDPTKAEAFKRHCTHWWLVVPDRSIVRDDLPEGWGLLVIQGSRLVRKVAPVVTEAEPMPRSLVASMMRTAATQRDRTYPPGQKP